MSSNPSIDTATTPDAPTVRNSARIFSWVLLGALAVLLWVARKELAPFLFAAILIYILLPVVRWMEQRLPVHMQARKRRGVAVGIVMVLSTVFLIVLVGLFIEPIVTQTRDVLMGFGDYWQTIQAEYPDASAWYEDAIPPEWRVQIDQNMSEIGGQIWHGLAATFGWLLGMTDNLVSAVLALVSIPLFLINYMLDERRTSHNLSRQFPKAWATEGIALYRIFDQVFGTYTKGVVLEAVIVGAITGLGYWVIGVELFLPLAAVAMIGEVVPIVGPWIAFFVSFPVILATQPELIIPAIVVFLVIQALEGWFLAPAIQASSNDFTNAGILVILAIGGAVGGPMGVIFALPAAALMRALSIYIYQRLNGHTSEQALLIVEQHSRKGEESAATSQPAPEPAAPIISEPQMEQSETS